jgi:hypothetical protein
MENKIINEIITLTKKNKELTTENSLFTTYEIFLNGALNTAYKIIQAQSDELIELKKATKSNH